MALNDIKVPKENAQGTFDEIALAASDLKLGTTSGLPLKTGTNGVIEAGSFGTSAGTFCEGNDSRLSDSRTPSSTLAHKASHATGGTDALAPNDIGAQSIFTRINTSIPLSGALVLDARRAAIYSVDNARTETRSVYLPTSSIQNGDVAVIIGGSTLENPITIKVAAAGSAAIIDPNGGAVTISATGQQFRFIVENAASFNPWTIVSVDTHTHATADITSGTFDIARLPVGTGSTQVAAGNHTHTQLHDRSHAITSTSDHTAGNWKVFHSNGSGEVVELALGDSGKVLQSNGATSAPTWETPSGGVSGVAASAGDVLGVSGSNITGVDAGADRLVFWDDSAGELTYLEAGSGLSISGTTMTATATGTIGGSSGSVDNAICRADGTGTTTIQSSDLNIDDASATTQNNVAITNQHSGQTDSSLVLTPKGTGAFIVGPKPDGTVTGGNARGAQAVDLQYVRNVATQVASGQQSCVLGGDRNTASGTESCVAGGFGNVASGAWSFAAGNANTASGIVSTALGGSNTASAAYGFVTGYLAAANRNYTIANSSGWFGTIGDSQAIVVVVLRAKSTSSTAVELFNGFSGDERFTIPSGKVVSCLINITAATSGGEHANQYVRAVMIGNRGGTTALRGVVKDISTEEQVSGADVTVEANDTNDAIRISFTGPAPVTGCTAEADDDVISKTAHGFNNNDDIVFTSLTGGAGLTANTVTYWVIDATADTFKVSATRGGGAVNITTDYSAMTATRVMRVVASLSAAEIGFGT